MEACCSHVLATYGKSVKYLTNGCGGGNDCDNNDDYDYDDMEVVIMVNKVCLLYLLPLVLSSHITQGLITILGI